MLIRSGLSLLGILLLLTACGTLEVRIEGTPTVVATASAPVADVPTGQATPAPTAAPPSTPTRLPTATATSTPSPQPTSSCAQAHISGSVCAPGEDVTLSSCCPEWTARTTTDAQGDFAFASLTPGTFTVSAQGRSRVVTLGRCDSTATVDLCPVPEVVLRPPMTIDGEAGRLYMPATVDGVERIVALAADNGRLLTTYEITGPFGVDGTRGWLYVDQRETGLAVLDVETGASRATIPLPEGTPGYGTRGPSPQVDPSTGQVLAFRDQVVYVIDPELGEVVETFSFDVPRDEGSCGLGEDPPIEWSAYDGAHRLLYLGFTTYACVPWSVETLASYDLNSGGEIARARYSGIAAVTAFDGCLYGSNQPRLSPAYRWAWRDGQPWFKSADWGYSGGFYVDSARGRLYELGVSLQILDAQTMALLMSIPSPVEGHLVGYDAPTDQLYFLHEGQLQMWPASAIQPPPPEAIEPSDPPPNAVWQLAVSPNWPQDRTLFGLWGNDVTCGIGARGGLPLLSSNGGDTWGQPRGGLRGSCPSASSMAFSPNYARDQTLFAGIVGGGVFKSTDGGQLWQPASAGLSSMYVQQILLSPGFERDRTAFVGVGSLAGPSFYRSTDAAETWQSLDAAFSSVGISPDFEQDQTLMGAICGSVTEVWLSRDGGTTWEHMGNIAVPADPVRTCISMFSLAPSFSNWQTAFAYGDRTLYRTTDGGHSWQAVLDDVSSPQPAPPLIYGPETAQGRRILLVGADVLYRSEDGGQTWQEPIPLNTGLWFTAVACSPNCARDGLLFVGTIDGQVITLDLKALIGEP